MAYVEAGLYKEAEVLAVVVDHLEECFAWQVLVRPIT